MLERCSDRIHLGQPLDGQRRVEALGGDDVTEDPPHRVEADRRLSFEGLGPR